MIKTVAVNEAGLRIGEDHPHAKLTDAEVELIRQLNEEGMHYEQLAEKFEISKWTVGRICRYEIRAQTCAQYKPVIYVYKPLDNATWFEMLRTRGVQGELEL